jgi:hypothetical protein
MIDLLVLGRALNQRQLTKKKCGGVGGGVRVRRAKENPN